MLVSRNGNFDVVVIQDQSQRPSFGMNYVYGYIMQDVAAISRAIQETNPCTQPVFFLTWGKRDGDTQNCNNGNKFCTFDGVQDLLTQVLIISTNVFRSNTIHLLHSTPRPTFPWPMLPSRPAWPLLARPGAATRTGTACSRVTGPTPSLPVR